MKLDTDYVCINNMISHKYVRRLHTIKLLRDDGIKSLTDDTIIFHPFGLYPVKNLIASILYLYT